MLGTVLVLAPLTLMPDAALGLSGRLDAVDFPDEYDAARRAVEQGRQAGREGDVLSLPFTSYRRPGWNDDRRTLDPVGRYLPADYLASDTLVVSGTEVPGEDERAQRVARDLATLTGGDLEQALASEGIAWVVADLETVDALAAEGLDAPGLGSLPDLPDAEVLHRGALLTRLGAARRRRCGPTLARRPARDAGWRCWPHGRSPGAWSRPHSSPGRSAGGPVRVKCATRRDGVLPCSPV